MDGEKAIAVWGQYMTRVLALFGGRREEALCSALTLTLGLALILKWELTIALAANERFWNWKEESA